MGYQVLHKHAAHMYAVIRAKQGKWKSTKH